MNPRLTALAVLVALVSPCRGMTIDDLRLQDTTLGGKSFKAGGNVTTSNSTFGEGSAEENVSENANRHTRFALIYRRSVNPLRSGFGSPVWGLEVAHDQVREQQGLLTYRGTSAMLDVYLGWAWRLTPGWHLEEGIIAGLGRSVWRQTFATYYGDGTDWDDSTTGFASEYGFDLGTYYTFRDPSLQIGVDIRHMVMSSHVRFTGTHVEGPAAASPGSVTTIQANDHIVVEGIVLSVSLGYRF